MNNLIIFGTIFRAIEIKPGKKSKNYKNACFSFKKKWSN